MGYLAVIVFWIVVLTVIRFFVMKWRDWRYHQPARYVSEIKGVRYFSTLPPDQFESLLMQSLKARGYTLLGNPWLGRSKDQGYVWKAGKKAVLATSLDHVPTQEEIQEIGKKQQKVRADRALLFAPFRKLEKPSIHGVDLIYGGKLVKWFATLTELRPPASGSTDRKCDCGSPMEERVNRAGAPLLVCSRYPDCKATFEPKQ